MLQEFVPFLVSVPLVVLYMLPTVVAFNRRVAVPGSVAIVSLLLGWTIIGWVVCLLWAAFAPTEAADAHWRRA